MLASVGNGHSRLCWQIILGSFKLLDIVVGDHGRVARVRTIKMLSLGYGVLVGLRSLLLLV